MDTEILVGILPGTFTPGQVAFIVALFGMVQHLFSCGVQSLPRPFPEERWYTFFYLTLHRMAGNTELARSVSEKIREAGFRAQDQNGLSRPHPGEDPTMGATFIS